MKRTFDNVVAGLLLAACPLAAVAEPEDVAADYVVLSPGDAGVPLSRTTAKFRYLFGERARWSGPLRWRYNHANAPGPFASDPVWTAGLVRSAFEQWTSTCGIQQVYEGETDLRPNSRPRGEADGVNVVGWTTLPPNVSGRAWVTPDLDTKGNLIIVDGDVELSVDLVTSENQMSRTGAHEWGHAIGLAHSNVNGAMMSGPPDTVYNPQITVQADDLRGCRCLYGPLPGQQVGFDCSLPEKVDLGVVPLGVRSTSRAITLRNDGTAPLSVNSVLVTGFNFVKDAGCVGVAPLAPGASCTVNVTALPNREGSIREELAISTSDGLYRVPIIIQASVSAPLPPPTVGLIEYYHSSFDHYFVTYLPNEIAGLDGGSIKGWTRTGRRLSAWSAPVTDSSPVCRFFSDKAAPKSSHFYTSFEFECDKVKGDGYWSFEGEVFHVGLPDANGTCSPGLVPVYRLYNDAMSGASNHRFTTDPILRSIMIARGWVPEGMGPGVTMCVPP